MQLINIHQKVFVHFRRRRMRRFYALFRPSAQTRVLDIGGASSTWQTESSYPEIFPVTLINRDHDDPNVFADARFKLVYGDATQLPFASGEFDIAFSNSVIEHMTTWKRQQAFAEEARRVAPRLWIQTPARSFPIEPHLLAPYFQYWPPRWQKRLARWFTLWGLLTRPTNERVDEMLSDIRLLTFCEMKQLFPDCQILRERFLGLTKSYIAVR